MRLTRQQRQQIQTAIRDVLDLPSLDTTAITQQTGEALDSHVSSPNSPNRSKGADTQRKSSEESFFGVVSALLSPFAAALSDVSSHDSGSQQRSSISSLSSTTNSQDTVLDLESFKRVILLLKERGYSAAEILEIGSYSDQSLSLFPGIGTSDPEIDTLMFAKLSQGTITLAKIKETPGHVEDLLESEQQQGEEISVAEIAKNQETERHLAQQVQEQQEQKRLEEQARQNKLKQTQREQAKASLPLSLEFDAYHQLQLALEQQIKRLKKHFDPSSAEKARGIEDRLERIEQFWLNNSGVYPSSWQAALWDMSELLFFLNQTKRWLGKETNSHKAISAALEESTNLLFNSTILAQNLTLKDVPEHRLGPELVRLLSSSDEKKITHALKILHGLSKEHQHALMRAFKKLVFIEESKAQGFILFADRTTIPHPKREEEAFQNFVSLFQHISNNQLENALRYALASSKPGRPNAYETPVVDLSRKTLITAHIIAQHKFSDAMSDAVFISAKSGGANGAGPLGGVYSRFYLDHTGELQSQLSLIKQATDHNEPNVTDNMREYWGGAYGARLVGINFAATTLVIIPGGKAGDPAAVYVESTYIPGFIDAHHAAYQALGYENENIPKRAKGRNGGQDILHPKPGSEKLFGSNAEFQKGLIAFVRQCIQHRIDKKHITAAQAEKEIMASFARAIIPRLLLGDKQVHTENLGFGEINGYLEFVSLDFGGTGRRPFNTDGIHKNTELCGEFSDEIQPFNGKGNKHGACYALGFPLDFYLHEGFIEETRKIIEETRQNQEMYFDHTIEEMKNKFGEAAVLKHFANEYKKFADGKTAFENLDAFKEFYLEKQSKRLKSLEKFTLELELANVIKNTNGVSLAAALKDFFSNHPDYQLNWVSLSNEVLLSSKVLRTALEKFSSVALNVEQLSQDLVKAFKDARGETSQKLNTVTTGAIQACLDLYDAEKGLYVVDSRDAHRASRVMQGIKKRLSKMEGDLSDDDKQQLLRYIHSYGHQWYRISEHQATYRALTQIICTIYGIESEEAHAKKLYENLMSLSKQDLQTKLNEEFPRSAHDMPPVERNGNSATSFSRYNGQVDEDLLLAAAENPLQSPNSR